MLSVSPVFQVHQPYRVKRFRVFDIGNDNDYFNDSFDDRLNNRAIVETLADQSYRPATETLEALLKRNSTFRFGLSLTGTALDQLEAYAPDVLDSFVRMVATERVEVLATPYYNSLAFFYSRPEFEKQVAQHTKRVQDLFGVTPRVFHNPALGYSNEVATWCGAEGYIGVLAASPTDALGWRSPNYLYSSPSSPQLKVMLQNANLSDDVTIRFNQHEWPAWPLEGGTYARWIHAHQGNADVINLVMDLTAFGARQPEESGIFNFLRTFPGAVTKKRTTVFRTPSEIFAAYDTVGEIDVPEVVSTTPEGGLVSFAHNDIQLDALRATYALEDQVIQSEDDELVDMWRKLQAADHFNYMGSHWLGTDQSVRQFNPYESPYDAYIAFMNALSDLQLRVSYAQKAREKHSAYQEEVVAPLSLWQRFWSWLRRLLAQGRAVFG